jgi:predicted nucleic acid-binding protein
MTTFVVDASVVINFLLADPESHQFAAAEAFLDANADLIAPPALLPEVLGRIAGERNGGRLTAAQADEATELFAVHLGIDLRPYPLSYQAVPRLTHLGANLTLADATYVLLGEATAAPVITQDGRMIVAAGKVTDHPVREP